MEFFVYDITKNKDLSDDNAVELGLSSGEIRQSILDRVREELKNKSSNLVKKNFAKLSRTVNSVEEADDALYDLSDDDISKTTWKFSHETIYVLGQEI